MAIYLPFAVVRRNISAVRLNTCSFIGRPEVGCVNKVAQIVNLLQKFGQVFVQAVFEYAIYGLGVQPGMELTASIVSRG